MKALDRAISYLNIKPRTKAQVREYLEGKGYDKSEVEGVISVLEEYRYVDDVNFVRLYFELGFDKGHGIGKIRQELLKKGVERAIIDGILEELQGMEEVPDQYERALEIGRQVLTVDISELDYEAKQKLRARIARRLATRGYTADIAYKAAKELVK